MIAEVSAVQAQRPNRIRNGVEALKTQVKEAQRFKTETKNTIKAEGKAVEVKRS